MKLLLAVAVFISSAAVAGPLTAKEREARRQADRGQSVPTPKYNYKKNVKYPGPLTRKEREARRQADRGQSVAGPTGKWKRGALPPRGKFNANQAPYPSLGCWYGTPYQRMICRSQDGN